MPIPLRSTLGLLKPAKFEAGVIAAAIVMASVITACGGSSSGSGSNTNTGGATSNNPLAQHFPKSTSVFGTLIVGTEATPDASMVHAANVMAEYLDNNEDGIADNQAVVDQLKSKGATLLMAATQKEIEALFDKLPDSDAYQDLYASEVIVRDSSNANDGEFDATLEEVLHLITHVGFANVYPDVFGERKGSVLANAMDTARGGQFDTIPKPYPAGAWYTYDDETCTYSCMATEYLYWALTSMLGAQKSPQRLQSIQHEWQLNTRALVEEKDSAVFALLNDRQYGLPTALPNGEYAFKTFAVTKTDSTSGNNNASDAVSETEQVSNSNITFELQFMNQVELQGGEKVAWSDAYKQPYIDASNQWLLSLRGVDNQPEHLTVKIKVRVKDLPEANGMAGPDSEVEVNGFNFPTSGEMIIGNHTYAAGFDQQEFKANILHELGHIIGIGSFTEEFVTNDAAAKGNVFRLPAEKGPSKAVAEYNRIYNNTLDYVPFSDDGGHLYDHVLQEDIKRTLDNGFVVPTLTKEFMANGTTYGRVTLAVLDDIGYTVDYTNAEVYVP